jgi:DNA polymerase-3 subunit delta'
MSVFASTKGAEASVALLERDIASGRIAHAYLFAGAAGRLPLEVALAFSAALVCPQGGCGTCDACLRVTHSAHPDVEVIEPAGMQLLVEQVRHAVRAAALRPVGAGRRVIVVSGADRMNPMAQNAFLKTLEEPPPSTTIVLLAPSVDALLDTVRSRCREIGFRPPPPAEVAALLEEQGVSAERARYSARVGGDLSRAVALSRDPVAQQMRADVVTKALEVLHDPGDALEAAAWLAGRTKELRDRVAEEHAADREAFGKFRQETKAVADQRLRREQRRAEQDALDESVDDIASVLRDVLVLHADPQAEVLNEDHRGLLAERVAKLPADAAARVIGAMGDIERCRRRLRANANVLLTMEEVFLALHRGLRPQVVRRAATKA